MLRRPNLRALFFALAVAVQTIACGSNANPNSGRVLISIAVTPVTAEAQNFSGGKVTFTATGTFSLPPSPAPVTFVAPYLGSFTIEDTSIATIVSTGTGTLTAQCVPGVSGTTSVIAAASANSGTVQVSAAAQLTCP